MDDASNLESVKAGFNRRYDPDEPLPQDLLQLREEYDSLSGDDQRTKHVYACAGLALYWAQVFEAGIQNVLVLMSRAKGQIPSIERFDELVEGLSRKTLGQLLSELRAVTQLDESAGDIISLALDRRNGLAHSFFQQRAEEFITTPGKQKMIAQLTESVRLFRIADLLSEAICQSLMQILGVPPENVDRYLEQQFQHLRRHDTEKGEL